jgi:hypothetical protein
MGFTSLLGDAVFTNTQAISTKARKIAVRTEK